MHAVPRTHTPTHTHTPTYTGARDYSYCIHVAVQIALHFVKDDRTRFDLAVQCGNLDIAVAAAKTLDDAGLWEQLAAVALRMGDHQVRAALRHLSVNGRGGEVCVCVCVCVCV